MAELYEPEIMEQDGILMSVEQRTNRLSALRGLVLQERHRLGIEVPEDDVTKTVDFTAETVTGMTTLEITELMNILGELLDEYAQLE